MLFQDWGIGLGFGLFSNKFQLENAFEVSLWPWISDQGLPEQRWSLSPHLSPVLRGSSAGQDHTIFYPITFSLCPCCWRQTTFFYCKVVNQVTYFMFLQSSEPFSVLLHTLCCHRGATLSFLPLLCHPDPHGKLSFPRAWRHFRPTEVVCKARKITLVIFTSPHVVQPLF